MIQTNNTAINANNQRLRRGLFSRAKFWLAAHTHDARPEKPKEPWQGRSDMPPGWLLQTDGVDWRWKSTSGGTGFPWETEQKSRDAAWYVYLSNNCTNRVWKDVAVQ
jgi:hypothetical protein